MDHCSIAWTTDEGFSSRGAKSITLQKTMISEALNCADHPNYGEGACHGYAATIGGGQGGGVGSFHHNLLAHCEGRNWSLSGGLTGAGAYDGAHDVFNNVVYNWGGRATDGGSHEINFVNNYYRMGAATSQKYLLRLQLEGTGTGTQSAYVSGNIREETDGTKTQDKLNTTYRYETSGGQVLDWQPFVDAPFFPSYATVETADAALKNVLSDVGANMPVLTDHDRRIIDETKSKTYTYTGSKTGKKGLIDREADAGGYEAVEEARHPEGYDTDGDGMPDWWETAAGHDPATADNNSDADNDGYTALEDFLNWMAVPHYTLEGGKAHQIDLAPLFRGYGDKTAFSVTAADTRLNASVNDAVLTVAPSAENALATLKVTAEEDGISLTRDINVCITGNATPVESIDRDNATMPDAHPAYTIDGKRMGKSRARQIVVRKGKKTLE